MNTLTLIGLLYIGLLFLIAYIGDRNRSVQSGRESYNNNWVYALSLAVYCSSWTFYGAVGTAAVDGLDYLAIYLGPFLVFVLGFRLVERIILISKLNNITSISDFLSSRYGKSRSIALLVTAIAVTGSLPYIALQLKAVSSSYQVLTSTPAVSLAADSLPIWGDVAFWVAIGMVVFTVLFGTRHLDATEHHKGMILAISFESIIKLVAILAVGYYAVYLLLNSVNHSNFNQFIGSQSLRDVFTGGSSTLASFITKTLLSMCAIVLLPRQFQVTVVEARDHHQFATAVRVMPVYLILTSIIVIPIALSGMVLLPSSDEDLYVLSLPLTAGNEVLANLAFIGGLSAATGMVIVASISLSTMICNDVVMPLLIRQKGIDILKRDDVNNIILSIRRVAILGLMIGAYVYYQLIDQNAQLANMGLVSFAAIAQFLPAMLFAVFWKKANSKGIFWGLVIGYAFWFYTLFLPTVIPPLVLQQVFSDGALLHPQALLGVAMDNSLTHGVVWSLSANVLLVLYFSLWSSQSVMEQLQASRFTNPVSGNKSDQTTSSNSDYEVSAEALYIVAEKIIGTRSTRALFAQYERRFNVDLSRQVHAERRLIAAVQTAIAGVIGSASAQRVISETLLGDEEYTGELTQLMDETSSVLKFNRNLLQTTLQNITHGIAVVDEDLNLVVWNDTYLTMFDYPEGLVFVGKPISEILQYSASRGDFAGKNADEEIKKRIRYLQRRSPYSTIRERANGTVIKATGEPMPNGGFVTTYEDITESVSAAKMLREANEELENRVQERTKKLEDLTEELEKNTRSKTRFLAAASHDLLQPINAARLFAHSISESKHQPDEIERLSKNIDQSLTTANDLLRALLDISKLDAGGISADLKHHSMQSFLRSVESEMRASANDKNLTLRVESEPVYFYSDRQLLFSVVQNLVSNALRYTPSGGEVVITANTVPEDSSLLALSVSDTGPGIEPEHLEQIFNEFYQIKDKRRRHVRGLGLGLSIVKRICALLQTPVSVMSEVGQGSTFTITLPLGEQSEISVEEQPEPLSPINARLLNTKVLCLDNDQSVLSAMQTLLQGWGCEVTTVLDYDEAIECYQSASFDLLLADYRLDGCDTGLDFLRFCKQYSQAKDEVIRGVLITAEQDKTLRDKAAQDQFMYLPKPVEPASLKSLILYLLDGS